jgi:3-dehydro-L-gulonate 2-dehydrogenase
MKITSQTILISSDQMKLEFLRILLKNGFTSEKADKLAEIFTANTLEGVSSHGVNRFPRFVGNVRDGYVLPDEVPSIVHSSGALEQWCGNLGPGPLNASFATERAMELADKYGIGMVALANTNHWMRGGTYGWQAARRGYVFIGWTNTCANMPAWGAKDPKLGNNPFVMAVPYNDEAVVLDFAMTQYSYGQMETYHFEGKNLPYPGGFSREGVLTTDAGEVLKSWRALPVGYWKGSAFSMLLDIIATVLSGGLATHEVNICKGESGISQVFMTVNLKSLSNFSSIGKTVDNIIQDVKNSVPENKDAKIRYPGENVTAIRNDNLKNGVSVNRGIWEKILSM